MAEQIAQQIKLPDRLVSSADLARITRELIALDEVIHQASLRQDGSATAAPRSSLTLEDLASLNNINLSDETQRSQLVELLKAFQVHAPRIHMSLATEPSATFLRKTIVWMRTSLHPLVLLDTGLQPTLAAGCMIRTNNKMFDMSLRNRFATNRRLLAQKIGGPSE